MKPMLKTLLCMAALAAGPAGAQGLVGGSMAGGRVIAALDSDGDGALSEAELQALFDQRFARLDADGDGRLSKTEFEAPALDALAAADADQDGKVSRSEARSQIDAVRKIVGLNH